MAFCLLLTNISLANDLGHKLAFRHCLNCHYNKLYSYEVYSRSYRFFN